MRRVALSLLAFTAFAAPVRPLHTQEVRQQGKPLTVPAYSAEVRWNRTAQHFYAFFIGGIAHAKSLGRTPEAFGRFLGDLYASGWGQPQSGTAIAVARTWYFNFEALPKADAQLVAVDDTTAVLRHRRTHVAFFGPTRAVSGVTLDDYDRAFAAAGTRINEYLGLHTRITVEGEWNVITISGRGSAVRTTTFPVGTYAVSFSAEAVQRDPSLAGTWEVTYTPNGHLTLRHDGAVLLENDFEVTFDQFALLHADVLKSGDKGCTTTATYRWGADDRAGRLTFARLTDDCQPRVDWFVNAVLTRK